MIAGNATAEMQFFDLGTSYGSLLPADCDGATLPPAGSPAYFTELNSNSLRIFQAQIDWDNSSNSSVTVLQNLTTQPFSTSNINIQQPGTSQTLMDLSDRLMYRLQYRNFGSYQVMLTNHTVNANGNGQAGVRWYELRNYGSGWSIYQQGTYAPDDGDSRWMASIAMNGDGDIALGYSVSSSSTYPSIRFAGQNAESTGTGVLDIPETTIFDGTASQTGINRWGDYSAMTVDPSDDQSFWFTTEYSTGGWNWRTRIASFSYAPVTEPPVADFSVDDTHPMVGQNVNFTDESTNVPNSWSWTFSPSTVTFVEGTSAGSKNPIVQFNASGFYTVTLVATNDIGSDTETKINYIETLDCSAVLVYPYEENFDEWAVSSPEMSCTADGSVDLDDCWVNVTGDDIDWDVLNTYTPSGETGPDEDHTSGAGTYLYTESSNCFDHTGHITSPAFNLSSLTNPELHFWYHMYGVDMGTLSIQASVDGGSTWSADLWSLSGDQGNQWNEAVISLSSYAGETNVMFRFTGATGDNWHSDMAIDDFSVSSGDGGTPPTANAGEDQTICESSTCQLDGSAYNNSSIEWSTSGDGIFSDVNDPEAVYTPGTQDINNGSVIITLTAFPIPPATSTSTDDMTLNIEQEPVADAGTTGETCEGVSFTVSDASASNYSSLLWTTDGTGTLTDAATLTPTYTPGDGETGQITLTLTAQGLADCPEATSQMTLNIIIGPTADAGSDGYTCEDFSYTVDGASATNYSSLSWTENGTGYLLNETTLSPTYVPETGETGTVVLTLTVHSQGSCSDAVSDMQLEIYPAPTAYAGADDESCNNTPYSFVGATATNGTSILWTTDGIGALTDETTLSPVYTPGDNETGNVMFTLTVNGQGTCNAAVSDKIVEFFPEPLADAGSDASVCEGNTYSVTDASASDYASLLWTSSGTGTLSDATTLTPTYTPGDNETGTVTLTLTAQSLGSCDDAVSDMQIEIFPEPTAYAGSDDQTCEGTPYMVTDASATNGSSVLWTTDGQGTITNETTLTPTYTPASGETGDVVLTLTVFGQGTCNDATSYKTVTYLASPTAYAGVDIETCEGNNYTVTDATAENYSSISWTENGTGYLTNANTLAPTYIPGNDETGVVTLTLTAQGQAGCADAVSAKQIEYFAEPFADAGPDEMTCAGTSFTISGASAADYSSLSWTEDGTGYLTDANTLTPTYVPGDNEEGIVTLTLTAEGLADCGSTASSMQLEIIGGASAYAGSDAYTCEDVSYTITDASAENYSTALWTTNGLGTILDETTLTPTYVPAQGETGVITMILTVQSEGGGMCGSAGSSMTLEIIPAPEADAGGDDMSCQNDTYTVSGATASENSTVLWTENGNGTLTDKTTLTPTYIPATDETGIVTLTLTVTSGNGGFCGDAVSSMDLDIIPGATADAGDDDIICEDESYTVTGASASDNSTYLWTTDGAGTLSDATTLTPTYTPATGETGIVTLTLSVTSGGGGYCGTAESYMNLEIIPQPFADAGPDGEVCQNNSYTVTGASASSNSTLLWTTNGTGQLTDINTLTPTYTPGSGETGDITLTLTVISGNGGMCGSASSFMTLEILPSAYADAGADGETCEETAFTVTGASASDNSTYLWTTDGTGTLTDATTLTPTYTPATDETGTVTLTLTVESGNGGMCGTATSTMSLEVYPEAYADAGQNDISCQNETYTITGAVASENSTILWTTNGLGTLEDETTISPTYYPDPDEVGEITFTLTVTSVNNGMCGTATSSMTLDIIPGAMADAGPDGETCEEETFTVTGASASSNSTVLWTTTGNGVLTGETTLTPSYTPAVGETGDITLTMTVESGGGACGTATSDMNLFIYPTPYADAGDDGESCQGEAYTITGASASDYSTYLWTTDGQGTLTDETTLTPTYIPDMEETGIVTFTLTVTSGNNGACGTDASSCTVDIIPGATAYAGPDAAVCQSESYTVSGATASENSTILWTTSGAGILSGETTLTPTYTPAEDETGDVTLTLTVTSGSGGMCGEAASSMTLTINGYPVADAGEEIIICESDVAQLDGYAENYVSVLWETFGDGSFNDPTLLDAIYYPGTADIESGSVKLVLTANSATCDPVSDETNLTITLQAYTDAGEDDEICDDETFQTSGYVENTQTFIWTSNGDGTFDDPTSLEAVYTPGAEDAYIGSVTLSLTGFSNEPCENSYTDNMVLTIETCTGVQIGENQRVNFRIMPNPAYDYVRFSVDNLSGDYAEVLLMDMMGKVVQTEKFEIRNNFIAGRLVLVGLNQGVYFVRIVSDEYEDAVRLIKLK
jgi:PKD repeat protein/cation transport regulator ChaC